MRHQKGTEFLQGGFFPAECDFAGRRLDSVYMDSESDFGSGRDCGRLVWAETAVLVENGEPVLLSVHAEYAPVRQNVGRKIRYLQRRAMHGTVGKIEKTYRRGTIVEVIEAARLENVPMWKIFKDIVVPMSSATGIYVFITTIVQGLQYVFTPIKVVTQGGPNYASSNLIYMSYHEAFTLYKTGTSSAVSVMTMALFIILLVLEFRFVEKGVYYEN